MSNEEAAVEEPRVEVSSNGTPKMSDKVIIRRWPDNYTLLGPPTLVKDIEEAADLLAQNQWMRTWISNKILEALKNGEVFQYSKRVDTENGWKGRPDGVVGEWRRATEDEVLNFVDTDKFATITGHSVSKRAQEKGYVLHYHEGAALIEAYDRLPRQAKVILDLLNETGRESFTEASIEVILTSNADKLNTRQAPLKIWGFYRGRFVDEGHVEYIDED